MLREIHPLVHLKLSCSRCKRKATSATTDNRQLDRRVLRSFPSAEHLKLACSRCNAGRHPRLPTTDNRLRTTEIPLLFSLPPPPSYSYLNPSCIGCPWEAEGRHFSRMEENFNEWARIEDGECSAPDIHTSYFKNR